MKRKMMTILCCVIAVAMLTMTSCKKKEAAAAADSDTTGATDNTLAENTSNDVVNIGAQAADQGSLSSFREANDENVLSSCATVMRDTVNKFIIVSFNGGTCLDGRTRSGTITFDYHLSPAGAIHYRDPGFTFTVTSNNYVVEGNHVNIINKTVTNITPVGFNPLTTKEKWTIAANISVVKANGNTITWICNRTKTLVNTDSTYTDAATPIKWYKAVIQIDGTASGTRVDASNNAESFSATATAMVRDFGCSAGGRHPWISGTLDYQPPSPKYLRHIDFGPGTCDLNATVLINGHTYDIVLP